MSQDRHDNGVVLLSGCCRKPFRLVCWDDGHVDLSCDQCGGVLNPDTVKATHTVKIPPKQNAPTPTGAH